MTTSQDELFEPLDTSSFASDDPNFYGEHGKNVEGVVLRIHQPREGETLDHTKVICNQESDHRHAIIQVRIKSDPTGWEYILKNIAQNDPVRIVLREQSISRRTDYYGNFRPYAEQSAETHVIWNARHQARIALGPTPEPDPEPEPVVLQRCSFDVPEKDYNIFKADYECRLDELGLKKKQWHLTQGPDNYMCQVFVRLSKNPPFLP